MAAINQKEYLKKYLSGGDEKAKKKRKKKHATVKRNVMIFDDDVDLKSLVPQSGNDAETAFDDEAPTVAEVVDERPKEEVQLEEYRKSKKWKIIKDDDDEDHDSWSGEKGDGKMESVGKGLLVKTQKSLDKMRDLGSDRFPARSDRRPSHKASPKTQSQSKQKQYGKGSDSSSSKTSKNIPRKSRWETSPGSSSRSNKQRHDSDSDQSPVRTTDTTMQIPSDRIKNTEKQRPDSDSDQSPERTSQRKGSNVDPSLVKTFARHDSDSDLSPQRTTIKHDSRSPVRKKTRHDSDSDEPGQKNRNSKIKEQTKRARQDSDSDPSPLRRSPEKSDSDLSPPRAKKNSGDDSDLSPDRMKLSRGSDSDLSPPRRREGQGNGQMRKATKTLAGTSAGLQDAATLKRENEDARKRNTKMFDELDDDVLGKHAKTIFRDKSGRKRDLKMEKLKEQEEEAKKAQEKEKFEQWGKGLAQKQQKEEALAEALQEMSKPMARYQNDRDLDAMLRDQDREGDPMLAFIKKKESKNNEKAGIKEKPKYKGPLAPPNRFNIQPGYRWDGVNRSNGFENKSFTRLSDKKAMEEVKYKWSVEDM